MKTDLDFATLCSALEVGVPARVDAAISLIADGTVGPDAFFHDGISAIQNLLGMYNSGRRPDLSGFREELETPTAPDRLSSDIGTLQRLTAACRQSSHEGIRAAADRFDTVAAAVFINRAASLPPTLHAAGFDLVGPTLDDLLQKLEQGARLPGMDHILGALDDCTGEAHADVRPMLHAYGLKFLAHQPASPEKAERALDFAGSVSTLPASHQREAFKDVLQLIVGIPQASLDHAAQIDMLAHPLTECAHCLSMLSDEAFGHCAIELLRASSGIKAGGDLQPMLCHTVGKVALTLAEHTGVTRFATLPEADKVPLFLEMLDSSLDDAHMRQSGGADIWGPEMLQHLPEEKKARAADLLQLVEQGRSPLLGFRYAMGW